MSATITPQELEQLRKSDPNIDLIDVRTPAEYEEVHVTFARNVPLDRFNPAAIPASDKPVYIICKSGNRGRQAAEKAEAAGRQAVNVAGGTTAWEQAGLPVARGRKTMSLERQVRITAGLLILLGVALSLIVHPYFIGLCGFVGAGLVFAGVTDTCGMASILGRMPWNQTSTSCGGTCTLKPKGGV